MLTFVLDHCEAIDQMYAEKGHGLRKYEMLAEDWAIAGQLRDVLKVSSLTIFSAHLSQ
jgi:hypothetical protein